MFLTCPQCQTQYRLDPRDLGVGGRTVHCTTCEHMWFQPPYQGDEEEVRHSREQPVVEAQVPAPPVPIDEDDLLQQLEQVEQPETFDDVMQDAARSGEAIPDVVKPISKDFHIPVQEYRPMGMGATQFGVFVFLSLVFSTAIVLFLVKNPLTRYVPAMASLYQAMGMTVAAPGEGLRLSEVIARAEVVRENRKLRIDAKMGNIVDHDIDYPALKIILKGPYGVRLKDWDYAPKGKVIKSGEVEPLNFEFENLPEDGATVQIKVVK